MHRLRGLHRRLRRRDGQDGLPARADPLRHPERHGPAPGPRAAAAGARCGRACWSTPRVLVLILRRARRQPGAAPPVQGRRGARPRRAGAPGRRRLDRERLPAAGHERHRTPAALPHHGAGGLPGMLTDLGDTVIAVDSAARRAGCRWRCACRPMRRRPPAADRIRSSSSSNASRTPRPTRRGAVVEQFHLRRAALNVASVLPSRPSPSRRSHALAQRARQQRLPALVAPPMVWLVIGGPLVVVVASFATARHRAA